MGEMKRLAAARALVDEARGHADLLAQVRGVEGRRLYGRCQVVDGMLHMVADGAAAAQFAQARRSISAGVAIYEEAVKSHPDAPMFRADLAYTLHQLAMCEHRAGDQVAAGATIERAIEHQLHAVRLNPERASLQRWLRLQLGFAAEMLVFRGDHAGAAVASRRLLQHAGKDGHAVLSAASNLANCMRWAAADLAVREADRPGLLRGYGDASLAALRRAVELGFRGARRLREDRGFEQLRTRPEFAALLAEVDRLRAARR
jgi:hypothetical protein